VTTDPYTRYTIVTTGYEQCQPANGTCTRENLLGQPARAVHFVRYLSDDDVVVPLCEGCSPFPVTGERLTIRLDLVVPDRIHWADMTVGHPFHPDAHEGFEPGRLGIVSLIDLQEHAQAWARVQRWKVDESNDWFYSGPDEWSIVVRPMGRG
jgi:hypothetical protein